MRDSLYKSQCVLTCKQGADDLCQCEQSLEGAGAFSDSVVADESGEAGVSCVALVREALAHHPARTVRQATRARVRPATQLMKRCTYYQ